MLWSRLIDRDGDCVDLGVPENGMRDGLEPRGGSARVEPIPIAHPAPHGGDAVQPHGRRIGLASRWISIVLEVTRHSYLPSSSGVQKPTTQRDLMGLETHRCVREVPFEAQSSSLLCAGHSVR